MGQEVGAPLQQRGVGALGGGGEAVGDVAQPVEEAVAEAQVDGAPGVPRLIGRTRRLSSPSGRALARTLSSALTLRLALSLSLALALALTFW